MLMSFLILSVHRGKPQEKCPLCQTSYCPEFKGIVCDVCKVGYEMATVRFGKGSSFADILGIIILSQNLTLSLFPLLGGRPKGICVGINFYHRVHNKRVLKI